MINNGNELLTVVWPWLRPDVSKHMHTCICYVPVDYTGELYGLQPSVSLVVFPIWGIHLSYKSTNHYSSVIMSTIASQITSLAIRYWTIYSGADQREHQSSSSLAFVWGIHRWPVNYPHKWPVTRKIFPFDDVIIVVLSKAHKILVHCDILFPNYDYEQLKLSILIMITVWI